MAQIRDHSRLERETAPACARPNWHGWRSGVAILGVIIVLALAGFGYALSKEKQPAAAQAALRTVTVSKPLRRAVDTRVDFLGQFSAVDKVELRAQVGGTLTEIHFEDGQIVHKGDLLFVIEPHPYEIKLAQANAQLKTALARLEFSKNQLSRAQSLRRNEYADPGDRRPAKLG